MKQISCISAFLVALVFGATVQATCDFNNEQCQAGSGNCTEAIEVALSGNLQGAVSVLSYGRYCGEHNYCRAVTDANSSLPNFCESGSEGCPADPCDPLDGACQTLDTCYAQVRAATNMSEGELPIRDRCGCDVTFVATAANLGMSGPINGSICDPDFYNTSLPGLNVPPIKLLQSEAFFLAINFCCTVMADNSDGSMPCQEEAVANGYEAAFNASSAYCSEALKQLANVGITVCPEVNPMTPAPAPAPSGGGESEAFAIQVGWQLIGLTAVGLFTVLTM